MNPHNEHSTSGLDTETHRPASESSGSSPTIDPKLAAYLFVVGIAVAASR